MIQPSCFPKEESIRLYSYSDIHCLSHLPPFFAFNGRPISPQLTDVFNELTKRESAVNTDQCQQREMPFRTAYKRQHEAKLPLLGALSSKPSDCNAVAEIRFDPLGDLKVIKNAQNKLRKLKYICKSPIRIRGKKKFGTRNVIMFLVQSKEKKPATSSTY